MVWRLMNVMFWIETREILENPVGVHFGSKPGSQGAPCGRPWALLDYRFAVNARSETFYFV